MGGSPFTTWNGRRRVAAHWDGMARALGTDVYRRSPADRRSVGGGVAAARVVGADSYWTSARGILAVRTRPSGRTPWPAQCSRWAGGAEAMVLRRRPGEINE